VADAWAQWEPDVALSEVYPRHCDHADLLRERVDGRIGQ